MVTVGTPEFLMAVLRIYCLVTVGTPEFLMAVVTI